MPEANLVPKSYGDNQLIDFSPALTKLLRYIFLGHYSKKKPPGDCSEGFVMMKPSP